MKNTVLNMHNVVKEYTQGGETVKALQKTNFAVKKGEFIAIIGPSGSGKSTFLTIAGGLRSPTHGTVTISGVDTSGLSNKKLSEIRLKHIGFILQASNLVPFLTVEKQLHLHDKVTGQKMQKSAAAELFKELGINTLRKKYPSELSGGERQRVAIAKVLYSNPDLILADEPTASLDTAKAFDVVKLLARETKARGKSTIMVTHDERLVELCDKVYEMHDGALSLSKEYPRRSQS